MRTPPMASALAIAFFLAGGARAAVGLDGSYYSFVSPPETDAVALEDITAAGAPTATFLATTVCFPSCGATANDATTLDSFLGANATDVSSNTVSNLEEHALLLTGFLTVPTTGAYTFQLGSDDGSELWVNNTPVVTDDGDHAFTTASNTVNLDAGVYPIQVLQFEDFGVTGLTVDENGSPLTAAQLSDSAAPEPSAWALMLLGVGIIGAGLRRVQSKGRLAIPSAPAG
jgi:hypothetical protein